MSRLGGQIISSGRCQLVPPLDGGISFFAPASEDELQGSWAKTDLVASLRLVSSYQATSCAFTWSISS